MNVDVAGNTIGNCDEIHKTGSKHYNIELFQNMFSRKKILNDVCPMLNLFFFRFADEVVCESSVNSAL